MCIKISFFFMFQIFMNMIKKKMEFKICFIFQIYIWNIFCTIPQKKKKIRNLINRLQFFEFTLINFNLESSRIPRILFNALYIIRLFTDFVS